jgi:hypothetical protein
MKSLKRLVILTRNKALKNGNSSFSLSDKQNGTLIKVRLAVAATVCLYPADLARPLRSPEPSHA